MDIDQKDFERHKTSFLALYNQEGRDIYKFIDSVAESMAYQNALVREYRRQAESAQKALRNLEKLNADKASGLNPNA